MKLRIFLLATIVWSLGSDYARAADVSLAVDVAHPSHPISPRLYGIFFEDINFGGDGGLNAELVKNGSFEFPQSLMGWSRWELDNAKGEVQFAIQAGRVLKAKRFMSLADLQKIRAMFQAAAERLAAKS